MNPEQRSFLRSLRQRHHLLWLLLGTGCALFVCSKLVAQGAISVGLLIGLVAAYGGAGWWAAQLIVRLVRRSPRVRSTATLFGASLRVGAFFSVLSLLFHLVLVVVLDRRGALGLLSLARDPILLRAAILPLLACVGAACTVTGTTGTGLSRRRLSDGSFPPDELASSLSHSARPTNALAGPSSAAAHGGNQDKNQQPGL